MLNIQEEHSLADKKKIIILFRAVVHYSHSSVQDTVRFLAPRVPLSDLAKMGIEWGNARSWWEWRVTENEKKRLGLEYRIAAKLP